MWWWCEKESKVSVGGAASGREEAPLAARSRHTL
jgi:hypothetical protein